MYCQPVARDWLTAQEAAAILGIKPATLYAYVSRGQIGRERDPGERTSRYSRTDVERLAARPQPGPRGDAGGLEVVIETALTLLDPAGRLVYRGWDVADAAGAGFEVVAHWLWTGERADAEDVAIPTPSEVVRVADGLDGVRAALAASRQRDTGRDAHSAGAVAETARTIIATMIAALPELQPTARAETVASRLWTRLTARPPRLRDLDLLDTTLVLLADHELAASTLAARVAASTGADPYLVVLAGLSTLGGPLHGGASEEVRTLLRDVASGTPAGDAIDALLDAGRLVPGFGHRVYRVRDPRAELLLDRLPPSPAARDVLAEMARRRLPFPNVDLALAQLAEAHDMVPGAGELLFAVARTAGWLAHAIEEYAHQLRFRPRAVYVGP
jgi:citrate synthase